MFAAIANPGGAGHNRLGKSLSMARFLRLRSAAAIGVLVALGLASTAAPLHAEGVLERVARTGQLRVIGPTDKPPLLSLDGQGVPRGYGMVVNDRVAALLSRILGRPVRVVFQPAVDSLQLDEQLLTGRAELACGLPFSWDRDAALDFSIPILLSGVRLMAPAGRFSGDPQALAGRSIGAVTSSLGESTLRGVQPGARVVPFSSLADALNALNAGQVDGVMGDSLLLKGMAGRLGLAGMELTPRVAFDRYALACAMPENTSAFRNVVNRAIASLQQGYLNGDPASVAEVDRWLGPGSAVNLPTETLQSAFEVLLTGVESFRPVEPAPTR
jgi:polar amino acid transport system substrate-binding protein